QTDALNRFLRVAISWEIAQREIVTRLALEDLSERRSPHRGLNRILDVGNVDLVARRRVAVDRDVQIGLAQHAENSKILDAVNFSHNADDLIALLFENFQIVAVDLRGQRALPSAHRLFHVVFDGLGKTPDDPGNPVEFAL